MFDTSKEYVIFYKKYMLHIYIFFVLTLFKHLPIVVKYWFILFNSEWSKIKFKNNLSIAANTFISNEITLRRAVT